MDQSKPREIVKNAAEQASQTANDAVQRVGQQVQPALDRGKAAVHDLANQASEAGRQVADRASEFVEGVAPQVRRVAVFRDLIGGVAQFAVIQSIAPVSRHRSKPFRHARRG